MRRDVGDWHQAALTVFATPDGSWLFSPRLDLGLADDAALALLGAVSLGDEEGGLGAGVRSLTARLTVFF